MRAWCCVMVRHVDVWALQVTRAGFGTASSRWTALTSSRVRAPPLLSLPAHPSSFSSRLISHFSRFRPLPFPRPTPCYHLCSFHPPPLPCSCFGSFHHPPQPLVLACARFAPFPPPVLAYARVPVEQRPRTRQQGYGKLQPGRPYASTRVTRRRLSAAL